MRSRTIIIAAIIVVAAATLVARSTAALAQSGLPAQAGDPCGGTGGNGQIVSVGNDSFTLQKNDGRNLIVTLSSQATIESSAGPVSLSDLKSGDRVTLVGGPNPDGSFTADTVVVCAAAATGTPLTARTKNADIANFDAATAVSKALLFGLIWFGFILFFWLKKKKSFVHMLFFTIFYVYLYTVLNYTLFQFQTLVLEKHFVPGLLLNGVSAGKSLNLIPLAALTLKDVRTSLLNILLMMPFGFGLPFVTDLRMKNVVVIGLLFSIAIESLQFITGLIGNMTFRIADINDVLFNTLGVVIGYVLFVSFARIYRRMIRSWKMRENPILRYVAERPQINTP